LGGDPENVVFTLNATYALNTAIKGIAERGDHFIISNMEHNAVFRPIVSLSEGLACEFSIADVLKNSKQEIISEIKKHIKKNTKAVIMIYSSNICSYRLPIREIGRFCKNNGIIFIVDASQAVGHMEINIKKDCINILCAPAHKGLYGCMGLGFLITDGSCKLKTLTEGGSGYNSADVHMPEDMPEHLEAGTLPVPAISALREGLRYVRRMGVDKIEHHEKKMHELMSNMLDGLPYVKQYMSGYAGSCLLFNVTDIPSTILDEALIARGICIRSGFHCSPLAHRALKSGEFGGVRCSFGVFSNEHEIRGFVNSLKDVVWELKHR
jgi:selenocysteine lyase/cysteine desulfurase